MAGDGGLSVPTSLGAAGDHDVASGLDCARSGPQVTDLGGRGDTRVVRAHGTKETATTAPALIMGFLGVFVVSSTLISLNASPNGSTPIFASTAFWPSDRGQAHM